MTNKELCDKYPWLIPTNRWTGERVKDFNYEFTELDDMPRGWRIAFGEQIIEELDEEMQTWSAAERENFRITQIKEKWGHLCFYTNGESEKFREIIGKYSVTSRVTCIYCGKPGRWISRGWISPFCDECARENYNHFNASYSSQSPWDEYYIDINEYYSKWEEEKED